MKTRFALLLPLLAVAGCADNNASVKIAGICAPPSDATSCTFGNTCAALNLDFNLVDVGVASNFLWLVVQIDNQALPNGDPLNFRVNTNTAYVEEYEVEYSGVTLPTARGSVLSFGAIPPSSSQTFSVFPVTEAIAAGLGGLVAPGTHRDIVAKMKLKGVWGDTTKFETGAFEIPIRVCNGGCNTGSCPAGTTLIASCPKGGQLPASIACK